MSDFNSNQRQLSPVKVIGKTSTDQITDFTNDYTNAEMLIQDQDDDSKAKEEYLHVLAENEHWKSQVRNMADLNR